MPVWVWRQKSAWHQKCCRHNNQGFEGRLGSMHGGCESRRDSIGISGEDARQRKQPHDRYRTTQSSCLCRRTIYATSTDGKDLLVMGNDGSHQKSTTLPSTAGGFVASEHG